MSKKRKLAVGDVEPEPSSHLRRSMRSAVLAGPLFPYKMSESTQKGAVRSNLKTFDVILPLVFQACSHQLGTRRFLQCVWRRWQFTLL